MKPKEYLLEAIHSLSKKHPFDDITVEMILREADVSRGTFYKYYRDKYDLANSYYSDYVSSHILTKYNGLNWEDCLKEMLLFIKQNQDYFKIMISNCRTDFLSFISSFGLKRYQRVYMHNLGISQLSQDQIYELEFYNAGCVRIFSLWIENGCNIPIENLVKMFFSLMPEKFTSILYSNPVETGSD